MKKILTVFAVIQFAAVLYIAFKAFSEGNLFTAFAYIAAVAIGFYLWINLVHQSPKK